jgi:hypothetical protein
MLFTIANASTSSDLMLHVCFANTYGCCGVFQNTSQQRLTA